MELYRQLAAEFPAVASHRHELAGVMHNLAVRAKQTNDQADAKRLLLEAQAIQKGLLATNPNQPEFRRNYCDNRSTMASVAIITGEHAEIPAIVAEMLAYSMKLKEDHFNAAAVLAEATRLAHNDNRLSAEQKTQLVEQYSAKAVEYLKQATALGFRDAETARNESRFASIRERADFAAWLASLAP
ncbi:MAG: TPR end-of-group domain-containing protein [Gemmataceae bacterium]